MQVVICGNYLNLTLGTIIADILVENFNRRYPRVGTGENRGDRFLLVHDQLPALLAMIWVKQVAFNEAFVALQEFFQYLFGGGALVW